MMEVTEYELQQFRREHDLNKLRDLDILSFDIIPECTEYRSFGFSNGNSLSLLDDATGEFVMGIFFGKHYKAKLVGDNIMFLGWSARYLRGKGRDSREEPHISCKLGKGKKLYCYFYWANEIVKQDE